MLLDSEKTVRDKKRIGFSRMLNILAFILGTSVSTGVVYAFMVGNTPAYAGYCVSAVICVYLMFARPELLRNAMGQLDSSLLVFVGIAALSIIPALVYCMLGWFDSSLLTTVIKGLVVLVAGMIVYIVAVALRGQRRSLIYGVVFGVILNVVSSFVAQLAFGAGSVWSLVTIFPQDAFVVSLRWGVLEPAGSHAIYSFRAQGLFLEPSHMMVFLVAWGLLCVVCVRRLLVKVVLLAGIIYLSVQAFSPNVAILLIEGMLFIATGGVLWRIKKVGSTKFTHSAVVIVLVMIFAFSAACVIFGSNLVEGLQRALEAVASSIADLNIASSTDTGTIDRFEAMTSTLSILPYYPFGAGWNTESMVLTAHFGQTTFASHSFALRLLLELGVIGFAAYCWMTYRHASAAFRSGVHGRYFGFAIACMVFAQFANGITLLPYVWLLLGVSKSLAFDVVKDAKSIVGIKLKGDRA